MKVVSRYIGSVNIIQIACELILLMPLKRKTSQIFMIQMIWTIFNGLSNLFMCSLNNINVILTEPIYLDTTFILVVILFLYAYVSLIILIILLCSSHFKIIKVST